MLLSKFSQLKSRPKCRVELHSHLDLTIRHETIWQLMREKALELPGNGTLEALREALLVKDPQDLAHYLLHMTFCMPALMNDLSAVERISYEYVEDMAKNDVAYVETRVSPFVFIHNPSRRQVLFDASEDVSITVPGSLPEPRPEEVLEAILRGLQRGEEEFGTKARVLLTCIREFPECSWEILDLCERYRERGVVGIDLSGNESLLSDRLDAAEDPAQVLRDDVHAQIFRAAKAKGINRTVHSGESGPGRMIRVAIEEFHAQRVGHGYRAVEEPGILDLLREKGIHVEVCPVSSYTTGTVGSLRAASQRHPVLSMVEAGVSFSFSSDDTTLTGTHMKEEARLLLDIGLTEAHLTRASFEGAQHSFLPPQEKQHLLQQLKKAYGVLEEQLSPRLSHRFADKNTEDKGSHHICFHCLQGKDESAPEGA
ncbi:adenosine deaminase-like [Oratosquilla oratoria]|uniref:adenosine deaminase-like n=1 Tax=Oratosquilla oratoria TaxID=337810 RepID=UPI003F75F903